MDRESDNVYQLAWLGYFMTSNRLDEFLPKDKPKDPIARAARTSRFSALGSVPHHTHFRGVMAAAKAGTMLQHLDIFDRTP